MASLLDWLTEGTTATATLAGATHRGKVRDYNEDAFGCVDEANAAIVADGMGGLSRGDEASREVVKFFESACREDRAPAQSMRDAHERIRAMSLEQSGSRMGSTAVSLKLHKARVEIDWIGDSRAYLWRSRRLQQLTRDHSFVQELVDAGALTQAEAELHPNRNVVTRAIGVRDSDEIKVDSVSLKLWPGDRLLLCSDGLSGFLPESRIGELMDAHEDPAELAERLIETTVEETEAGDNVTVVVARISI